jgi:molybdopterin synthase catalytic subunit
MVTKDVWAQVHEVYAGRAHFVVFDFTNDATTASAAAEAKRLGLEPVFHEYSGATGFVVVFDGRTREVTAEIGGRDFEAYRAAIDAAMAPIANSARTIR